MSSERLAEWLPRLWQVYREDLLRAGMSPAAAEANIARNRETLFDGPTPRAGQYFFDAVDDGTRVGSLWLAQGAESAPEEWYLYDIVVDEGVRGHGYGRAMMAGAEQFVVEHRGQSLALNVFGFNDAARSLYRSMGYAEVAVSMKKRLD